MANGLGVCTNANFAPKEKTLEALKKGKIMSTHNWADVTNEGELLIQWDEVAFYAYEFDIGKRDYNSALGKFISLVERKAFEEGYKQGIEAKSSKAALLAFTGGTA